MILNMLVCFIFVSGLDEALAEAIDDEFYNSYKTWKEDHSRDSTDQKVDFHVLRTGE